MTCSRFVPFAHRLAMAVATVCCLVATACGGGGGGAGGGGSPPPAGELVRIFPPHGGVTEAAVIEFRGTASSPTGITSVTVEGVPATSNDGFAHWSLGVPLAPGTNQFAVVAKTGSGADIVLPDVTIRRVEGTPGYVWGVAIDAGSGTVYAAGGEDPRLFAIDASTKAVTVVSGPAKGTGPSLYKAYSVVVDASGTTAYVGTNPGGAKVLAVNLATGDRTILSGGGVGQGASFASVGDLELDAAGNRLLVTDYSTPAIFWVSLTTGDRIVVSGAAVGAGPMFTSGSSTSTALDITHGRAFVAQGATCTRVDLASGDRTIFASNGIGQGPPLGTQSIVYDLAHDQILVGTRDVPTQFISLNPVTGDRVVLTSPAIPPGAPQSRAITAMAHDADGGRLLLADYEGAAIRSFDLSTGVQADVWRTSRGAGIEATKANAATLAGDGRVLIKDEFLSSALVAVDLATGDRSILDGGGVSMFENAIATFVALGFDAANNRALFAGSTSSGHCVITIDAATGARTIASPSDPAFGPQFTGATGLAADGTTAWITTTTAEVLEVDLATGMRTVVSNAATGQGPVFTSTRSVVADSAHGRLLVGANTIGENGIFSVDLATGDRTPLYTSIAGVGPKFGSPDSLGSADGEHLVAGASNSLYDVDAQTASGDVLASEGVGVGVRLGTPLHVAGVTSHGIVVVYDGSTNAVLAIDPTSGDRIILSK